MIMEIYGAKILDLSLLIEKTLIIADLHLGIEEAIHQQGILIPKIQYKKILKRLSKILDFAKNSNTPLERIIINGDLKHEFGKISYQEWNETLNFIKFLKGNFKEIVLVRGNHDNFIKNIMEKENISMVDKFYLKNFLIIHGHEGQEEITREIKKDTIIDTIVIAHEHPCIGLRKEGRTEKIKCFLKGKFKDKNLIVLPSFNFVTEGTDIAQENTLSPFLKNTNLLDFEIYGVENFEIFYFGKLGNFLEILK